MSTGPAFSLLGIDTQLARQQEADRLMVEASNFHLRFYGDPILTQPAQPVLDIGAVHPGIALTLFKYLDTYRYAGDRAVGIAAPQIGVSLQIAAVPIAGVRTIIYNPRIVQRSDATLMDLEGCMSIPGFRCGVERHAWVDVEYDVVTDGELERRFHRVGAETVPHPTVVQGQEAFDALLAEAKKAREVQFEARVLQHELDHLRGVQIVDGLGRNRVRQAERAVRNAQTTHLKQ